MARKDEFLPQNFLADMAAGGERAERAARLLLRVYRPKLRARYFRKGVSFDEMEELDAEVFSAVMFGWYKLEAPAAFTTWFYSIADNKLNQHWAQKMSDRKHLVSFEGSSNTDEFPDEEAPSLIDQALPDLSSSDPEVRRCFDRQLEAYERRYPTRRACIELVLADHGDREIAAVLGRTHGAARQHISQCLALLASFLSHCLGPDDLRGRRRGQARPEV
ncbi:MAG: hypothetical protein WA086_11000 [Ideonella sp.]